MTDFETWLMSERNLRPGTARLYRRCMDGVRRMIGRDPRPDDIKTVRSSILVLSETSRRNTLTALEHYLAYAGTPVEIPDKPNGRRRSPEYLSEDQIEKLFSTTMSFEERALLYTLYYGALRIQEATHLEWKDVTPWEGRIRIRNGKGGGDAEVFVVQRCVDALRELWTYEIGDGCVHDYVFHYMRFIGGLPVPMHPCKPMTKHRAYEIVVRTGERAGIPLHPHMLRHSIATAMVNRGCPLPFLQAHLRHADPEYTLIYYHLDRQAQKNAIEKFMPGGS